MRILASALGVLALAVVLHAAVVTRGVAWVIVLGMVAMFEPIRADDIDACVASPGTWSIARGSWTAYAYDRDTLLSANPKAPRVDGGLRWSIQESLDGRAVRLVDLGFGNDAAVSLPTGRSGSCSLVVLRWPVEPATRDALRLRGLLNIVGVSLLGLLLAFALAVRPFARSVSRLAESARHVGTPEFAPVTEESGDLGTLAQALSLAHKHVVLQRELDASARAGLERHLADVAHDLRTPITSLQLRLEELVGANDPRISASLDDVVYLGLLVENLHMAACLREGRGGPPPIAYLGEVVDRVAARFEVIGRCRHVSVHWVVPDQPIPVRAESVLVEQAVANLLHNAVAHNTPGGNVAVVLSSSHGRFELVVRDDGPGVGEAQLAKLTERTFRTDGARARDHRGSGLGLAIVREVCDQSAFALTFEVGQPGGLVVRMCGDMAT